MNDEIKKEVELLVLNEKIQIIESRHHFALGMAGAALAIFGIMAPLYITLNASSKVDSAISNMQAEYQQILGDKNRKPNITLISKLGGSINTIKNIDLTKNKVGVFEVRMKNSGTEIVNNAKVEFTISGNRDALFPIILKYKSITLDPVIIEGSSGNITKIFSYIGNISPFVQDVTPILLHPQEEHHIQLKFKINTVLTEKEKLIASEKVSIPVSVRVFYGEPNYKEFDLSLVSWIYEREKNPEVCKVDC